MTKQKSSDVDIKLRKGSPEDAEGIVQAYKEFRKKSLGVSRIRKVLKDHPSSIVVSRGRIVGFCYCLRFAPDILEIANIFISKDFRNEGLGGKLISTLNEHLQPETQALIAVNSMINSSFEEKLKPTNFYLKNKFEVIYENENSTVYLRHLE